MRAGDFRIWTTVLALLAASAGQAAARPLPLRCGEDHFQVSFLRDQAVVRDADGAETRLPRLAGGKVSTYTNGRMTFTRSARGRTTFARGRMAAQACRLAEPVQATATPGSCRAERGLAAAQVLADRCRQVSPATHPPCNVENPCDLIQSEVRRGCDLIGADAPAFCKAP